MEPKVSIIIPVYNVEKYLFRCVNSVCNQSFTDIEIILVDDGSTDSSGQLCDTFAKNDARIGVIHQKNGGLSDARNTGLLYASGQWISFIDSDDWIEEFFIENLIKEADKNQCDVVGCAYRRVYEDQQYEPSDKNYSSEFHEKENIMPRLIDNTIQQVVWNKLYKKTVIDGIFFEKGKYHEDEFWSYQILSKVNLYIEIDYVGYNYFQRVDSIMGKKYSLKRLHVIEAKIQRQKFLEKNMPNVAIKGKINLIFTCLYHGQLVLKQLDENERQQALEQLKGIVKEITIEYKELIGLSFTHKIWIILSKISFISVCKIRNICKIGI